MKSSPYLPGVNGDQMHAKVWVDLDNTPHVPFFEPIIREFRARGYEVLCTARDAFQVCDLARQRGLSFQQVGRHSGKNRFRKALGLFYRALQLLPIAFREKTGAGNFPRFPRANSRVQTVEYPYRPD